MFKNLMEQLASKNNETTAAVTMVAGAGKKVFKDDVPSAEAGKTNSDGNN
jgi:hypothetical protein